MAQELKVKSEQAGQKLFPFLKREIQASDAEFHRWIRTGQVRLNKGRTNAFARIKEGDSVRIPPFAILLRDPNQAGYTQIEQTQNIEMQDLNPLSRSCPSEAYPHKTSYPPKVYPWNVVYEDEQILVINKPSGLATQGGTGQTISVVSQLRELYKNAPFMPEPAHRLDKDTSGILLIGKTYTSLRELTDAMKNHEHDARKEYVAWVHGSWQDSPCFIAHYLYKDEKLGKMQASFAGTFDSLEQIKNLEQSQTIIDQTKLATSKTKQSINKTNKESIIQAKLSISHMTCLEKNPTKSLMLIRIYTGRKHQIRVQVAQRGHAIIGDKKYSSPCLNPVLNKDISNKPLSSQFPFTKTLFTPTSSDVSSGVSGTTPFDKNTLDLCESLKLHAFRMQIASHTFLVPPLWKDDFAIDASIID